MKAKQMQAVFDNPNAPYSDKVTARQLAEISAFSETFMKGINPESVEDMRNALEEAQELILKLYNSLPIEETELLQNSRSGMVKIIEVLKRSKL